VILGPVISISGRWRVDSVKADKIVGIKKAALGLKFSHYSL
jgi:hypothetical protein